MLITPIASARKNVRTCAGFLCRFLDAGGTEALHTRGGPASKKRQGAKSRGHAAAAILLSKTTGSTFRSGRHDALEQSAPIARRSA